MKWRLGPNGSAQKHLPTNPRAGDTTQERTLLNLVLLTTEESQTRGNVLQIFELQNLRKRVDQNTFVFKIDDMNGGICKMD